ncbi:hypothetical protein [Yinghuangia soli]|uniref:PknH-like extracellular domain-containing protein n=1 Tax=Yinghuangia soli TaxID=2908204 RepID=A0AA41PUA2_9ACTN|nr:hypothetical protein [Yinghuangia soli]MCF2525858.1 hypothetical protein [Yinghuangia soli]
MRATPALPARSARSALRALLRTAAAPLLAVVLVASCTGGSDTAGTPPQSTVAGSPQTTPPGTPASPAGEPPSPSPAPSPSLADADLESVLIADGDVPGYFLDPLENAPGSAQSPDEGPACRPENALFFGAHKGAYLDSPYRRIVGTGLVRPAAPAGTATIHISTFDPGQIENFLQAVRESVPLCLSQWRKLPGSDEFAPVADLVEMPPLGDDRLAISVLGSPQTGSWLLTSAVVRVGNVLIWGIEADNDDDSHAGLISLDLLRAQVDKVTAAATAPR